MNDEQFRAKIIDQLKSRAGSREALEAGALLAGADWSFVREAPEVPGLVFLFWGGDPDLELHVKEEAERQRPMTIDLRVQHVAGGPTLIPLYWPVAFEIGPRTRWERALCLWDRLRLRQPRTWPIVRNVRLV